MMAANATATSLARPLFGGAITCEIPSHWRDVSDLRQVPDHQEVYMDSASNSEPTLIVEILERQGDVSHEEAAEFFFRDLAEANGAQETHIATPSALHSGLFFGGGNNNIVACTLVGYQKIAMGRDFDIAGNSRQAQQEVRWVKVELCVARLDDVETDLLITVSSTVRDHPSATVQQSSPFSDPFQRVLSTLQIRDWGLFG